MIRPVPMTVSLPAGFASPEPVELDVRAFLVEHPDGVTLIDTGFAPEPTAIADGLAALGATWSDVTDVLLTHHHPDHVGGLARVRTLAPGATVWGSPLDTYEGSLSPLAEGTAVRGLEVLALPGHTPGHLAFLQTDSGAVFAGDVAGTMHGTLAPPPARFTADAERARVSLRRLADLAPVRVLFSHGPELDDPAAALQALAGSV